MVMVVAGVVDVVVVAEAGVDGVVRGVVLHDLPIRARTGSRHRRSFARCLWMKLIACARQLMSRRKMLTAGRRER